MAELPQRRIYSDPPVGEELELSMGGADLFELLAFRWEIEANDGTLNPGLEVVDDDGDHLYDVRTRVTASSGQERTVVGRPGLQTYPENTAGTFYIPTAPMLLRYDWKVQTSHFGLSGTDRIKNARAVYRRLEAEEEV